MEIDKNFIQNTLIQETKINSINLSTTAPSILSITLSVGHYLESVCVCVCVSDCQFTLTPSLTLCFNSVFFSSPPSPSLDFTVTNGVPPLTPGTTQQMSQFIVEGFKEFEKQRIGFNIPKGE